jgi:hypothetical protein
MPARRPIDEPSGASGRHRAARRMALLLLSGLSSQRRAGDHDGAGRAGRATVAARSLCRSHRRGGAALRHSRTHGSGRDARRKRRRCARGIVGRRDGPDAGHARHLGRFARPLWSRPRSLRPARQHHSRARPTCAKCAPLRISPRCSRPTMPARPLRRIARPAARCPPKRGPMSRLLAPVSAHGSGGTNRQSVRRRPPPGHARGVHRASSCVPPTLVRPIDRPMTTRGRDHPPSRRCLRSAADIERPVRRRTL